MLDLDRVKRPSTLRDIASLARLADKLEYVDFFIIPTYPHDINIDSIDINSYYQAFRNTGKPVMGGILNSTGLEDVIRIASQLAGGRELLRKTFCRLHCLDYQPIKDRHRAGGFNDGCGPPRSPSRHFDRTGGRCHFTGYSGDLVQQNAEALMGIVITQLVNPGTPVLYSAVPVTMDMPINVFPHGQH